MEPIVVWGTRGMARDTLGWMAHASIADQVVGLISSERDEVGTEIAGLPVLGDPGYLAAHPETGVVLALGASGKRVAALRMLQRAHLRVVSVIHPSAVVGPRCTIGEGAIVAPGVVVGADAALGAGVILNYNAVVGHDCMLDDGVFVGPNAAIAGTVRIGTGTHVGLGAAVVEKVTIGAYTMVGAGAVVVGDVADSTTVVGVPARPVPGSSGLPPASEFAFDTDG